MLKTILAAAITVVAAGWANAQTAPSFYLAATGGATTADVDCAGATACDASGRGWKLIGGVKVAPDVALEVQVHDFGTVSADIPGSGPLVVVNRGVGFGVAVSSTLNNGVDLFFRLGIASNKTQSSWAALGASREDTATKGYYGMGVAFKLSERVSLRLEVDGTTFKPTGQNMSTTMFSGGASFRF